MALDTESLGSLRIDRSTCQFRRQPHAAFTSTIAVVVVVLAAGAWFFLRPKPTEITTVVAEAESSGPSLGTSVLNASGYVVARRMATVSSKVTGKVLEIYVEEGMEVKKDQVLARLDPENSSHHADDGRAGARSRAPQSHRDRSAPRGSAPQSRAQRNAGEAAAREPDGARYFARRSERAGRAPRGLAGAGQGVREQPRHAAHRLQRSRMCARRSTAWSFPRTRSRAR